MLSVKAGTIPAGSAACRAVSAVLEFMLSSNTTGIPHAARPTIHRRRPRRRQEKSLIEKVTQAFVDALGVKPDSVWITVQDVEKAAWGIGGKTLAERG
jgi:4-oxalocrotonate tautomerase